MNDEVQRLCCECKSAPEMYHRNPNTGRMVQRGWCRGCYERLTAKRTRESFDDADDIGRRVRY